MHSNFPDGMTVEDFDYVLGVEDEPANSRVRFGGEDEREDMIIRCVPRLCPYGCEHCDGMEGI